MGERDLFEYWSETYKTHTMDWTQEAARGILAEWQRRFSEEVEELLKEEEEGRFEFAAFSTSQLDSILEQFAEFSWPRMAVGFALMVRNI